MTSIIFRRALFQIPQAEKLLLWRFSFVNAVQADPSNAAIPTTEYHRPTESISKGQ